MSSAGESYMKNGNIYRVAALVWLLGSLCVAAAAQEPQFIELTKADLFSKREWTSLNIRVGGFRLGMTRQEANNAAQENGYKILNALDRQVDCAEKHCEV